MTTRLTAIGPVETPGKNAMWLFRCSCGKEIVTRAARVRSGHTKSCGCLAAEANSARSRKHGHAGNHRRGDRQSRTYQAWCNLRLRCSNPNNKRSSTYLNRGIRVCERWLGPNGFESFLSDMGEAPPGMSIDRIDNDGNYEPSNCRWATRNQQARNKTTTKLNDTGVSLIRYMHKRGANYTQLAHAFGVTSTTISYVVARKTWR